MEIFFSEFGVVFAAFGLSISLLWYVGARASNTRPRFARDRHFPELANLAKAARRERMHQASKAGLRHLRFVLPALLFALFIALGIASGETTFRFLPTDGSFWPRLGVVVGTALPFVFVGGALSARLEAHYLRPFLEKLLDDNSG